MMKFELVYLVSLIMFAICAISLGYTVLKCLKGQYVYNDKKDSKSKKIKYLDYNIHLDISDYVTYEKYQIWRFYFPA